ncbi:hypothetical protein CesoFtcFv8_011316 [Champsocephalus esox]|uniref:Uncharacterized protein n=1 Tax=Champsocephalus esox TaxID=159716 RepID=A0AAN8C3Y6_9TELE|nr:hypothetical protein CesoFtcFv8_011316 [Champsocephalus esox]
MSPRKSLLSSKSSISAPARVSFCSSAASCWDGLLLLGWAQLTDFTQGGSWPGSSAAAHRAACFTTCAATAMAEKTAYLDLCLIFLLLRFSLKKVYKRQ